MIELATKFKIQSIESEFVGELQQDVDAMIQVKSGVALTGREFTFLECILLHAHTYILYLLNNYRYRVTIII